MLKLPKSRLKDFEILFINIVRYLNFAGHFNERLDVADLLNLFSAITIYDPASSAHQSFEIVGYFGHIINML
jgi:hypothetical protein